MGNFTMKLLTVTGIKTPLSRCRKQLQALHLSLRQSTPKRIPRYRSAQMQTSEQRALPWTAKRFAEAAGVQSEEVPWRCQKKPLVSGEAAHVWELQDTLWEKLTRERSPSILLCSPAPSTDKLHHCAC